MLRSIQAEYSRLSFLGSSLSEDWHSRCLRRCTLRVNVSMCKGEDISRLGCGKSWAVIHWGTQLLCVELWGWIALRETPPKWCWKDLPFIHLQWPVTVRNLPWKKLGSKWGWDSFLLRQPISEDETMNVYFWRGDWTASTMSSTPNSIWGLQENKVWQHRERKHQTVLK